MAAVTTEDVERRAAELSGSADKAAAADQLLAYVEGDKTVLEAARNHVVKRLHGNAGDWGATASLNLLNAALVRFGWTDTYDWKIRWTQRFKRP